MWFWFILLVVVTGLAIVYRALTLLSVRARAGAIRAKSNQLVDRPTAERVSDKLRHGDWFFLCLVGTNLDSHIFARLVNQLDKLMMTRPVQNGIIPTEKIEKIA
jgi:hypothetical protein